MTIKQQGGIFGRNPTFNDVDATDITSSTITATTSVSTPVETISGNTSSVAFSSNSAGMLFSGGTDATKYSGIVFRGANSWNTFLGRIPDGAADPLVIGNDAISAFGAMCTFGYNDVTINRGNLVIGTSGKGIDFSATSGTGTSELLDDYEEGTWTPTINGTADTTYSTQYGWYTKVGNLVSVGFELTVNTEGTITGNAIIAGLPFTSGASDSKSSGSLSYSGSSGFSSVWQGIVIGNNQSLISIYVKSAASGSTTSLNGSDFFANGTSIIGQLTYKV